MRVKEVINRYIRRHIRSFAKQALPTLAVLFFAGAGVYLLATSHAASVSTAFEAENGVVTSPASQQTDAAASGGGYVSFNQTRTTPVKLMPLGDSITNGFQYQPSEGGYRIVLWQKLVQQDHDNIDFVGSGQSGPAELGDRDMEGHDGWTIAAPQTNELSNSIDGWLATYKPDIILLHAGTNDISFNASGDVVAGRLDSFLGQIYTDLPNVKVFVAQIIPRITTYQPQITAEQVYHDAIPGIVAKYTAEGRSIQAIDMSNLLSQTTDYADTLHPNNQGYDKMGAAWYPIVSALYQTY